MDRILITGASGFFGGHLCGLAQTRWEVFGTFHSAPKVPEGATAVPLDLVDDRAIRALLRRLLPDVIVLGAVLQVDACEVLPDLAETVNVHSAGVFADWCRREGCRLLYLSSDLVFDGEAGMYAEEDPPQPINVYGRTKLAGEHRVLDKCAEACVVRLPLMYGFPQAGGSNFFDRMLKTLMRREPVTVFRDQYRTPGLVGNMAEAVLELAGTDFAGIVHVAGPARCSRADLARAACKVWRLDENLLRVTSMYEMSTAARRPQDVSLDCSIATTLLSTRLLDYEEGLARLRG